MWDEEKEIGNLAAEWGSFILDLMLLRVFFSCVPVVQMRFRSVSIVLMVAFEIAVDSEDQMKENKSSVAMNGLN